MCVCVKEREGNGVKEKGGKERRLLEGHLVKTLDKEMVLLHMPSLA